MRGGYPMAIWDGRTSAKDTNGVKCVMNDRIPDIKPSEIYSDLSEDDIAEMMAEAATVDALFQCGQISTLFLTALSAAAYETSVANAELTASAA
jgi:hypothetical protein